jgi:dihydrofolate reductase
MSELNRTVSVAIIVAMAEGQVIGVDNRLPWHLPADLKYFKATTLGKPIVMGRKTYESIGRPLPGRRNIVVSSNKDYAIEGVTVVHSIESALAVARDEALKSGMDEVMVIGGAQLYRDCLPLVDRLYVTRIHAEIDGDATFPALDWSLWQQQSREDFAANESGSFAYSFLIYSRKLADKGMVV